MRQLLAVMHDARHLLSCPHTRPPLHCWVGEQLASAGSWQTPEPYVVSTQASPLGQSREDAHSWWQRLKMQTSGLLQSLLSEHPDARPTPDDLDEQPGIAQAMATATATRTKTHANRRRRMDMGSPPKRPAWSGQKSRTRAFKMGYRYPSIRTDARLARIQGRLHGGSPYCAIFPWVAHVVVRSGLMVPPSRIAPPLPKIGRMYPAPPPPPPLALTDPASLGMPTAPLIV